MPNKEGLSDAALHKGGHTNAYYDEVYERLKGAKNKKEVIKILNSIRNDLSSGKMQVGRRK